MPHRLSDPTLTVGDNLIRFFCNSSVAELRWFIGASVQHFTSRTASSEGGKTTDTKVNEAYQPKNLILDLDERVVLFPPTQSQTTLEQDLASFLAGLTSLYLDYGTQDQVAKQCRIRCKNTALHVQHAIWNRLQSSLAMGQASSKVVNAYQSLVRGQSPVMVEFSQPGGDEFPAAETASNRRVFAVPPAEVITRPALVNSDIDEQQRQPVTLVIPSAGRSSRFPGHKPKWMLTQPNGTLMIVDALSALELSNVDRLVIGILREHVDKYCHGNVQAIITAFADGHKRLNEIPLTVVVVEEETVDQVQTIEAILHHAKITGAIFLKDCDNQFACPVTAVNGVATLKITPTIANLNIPGGKSYAKLDAANRITNIAEKEIISNTFCIGGYSFASATDMLSYVSQARSYQRVSNAFSTELAVSDIIWLKMMSETLPDAGMADGKLLRGPPPPFVSIPASSYEDWGTIGVFQEYQRTFKTLFVDIDGTLTKNAGQYFGNVWGAQPALAENVALLRAMHERGRTQIILTTSRTERFRAETEAQLARIGMPYDHLILGLLHAQRFVINDYAKTNPFPSAVAINLKRDADELASHMELM